MASRSLSRLRKLSREIPTEKKVLKLLRSLTSADHHAADRAAAIVGCAFVEAALETAILAKFVPMASETERSNIFDGESGPLATLSARIRIGHALGIFGPQTRKELDRLRHIRNAYAHSASQIKFITPEISAVCDQLSLYQKMTILEKGAIEGPKDKYIATVAFIASRLRQNVERETAPSAQLRRKAWGDLT